MIKIALQLKGKWQILKNYVDKIINQGTVYDHNVKRDGVESQVDSTNRDKVVQVSNEMKTGKHLNHQMYSWS